MKTLQRSVAQATITGLDVWPIQQPHDKRAFVVVRVSTDAGADGWGEAAAGDDVRSAAQQLAACRSLIVGQDALGREHLRGTLSEPTNRGAASSASQAAIDTALVDILGKLTRAPAYESLGGPTRTKARAIALLEGVNDAALLRSLRNAQQAGFRAASVPLPMPTGPTRGRRFYRNIRALLDRLRAEVGEGIDFVLDCHGRTTPAEAGVLASVLESFHLLWLDEPTAVVHSTGLSSVAAEHATPIGWGRTATTNAAFQDMLRQDALDVVRPDIATMGLTQIRKAAALAETYYVAAAPYNRGGPIGTAAALHVAASIPNFFVQEVPFPTHEADRQMRREIAGNVESIVDGYFALPSGPGLGVGINVEALENYRVREG